MDDQVKMALFRLETNTSWYSDPEILRTAIEAAEANFDEERQRYLDLQAALRSACGGTRKTPPDSDGLWLEVYGDGRFAVIEIADNTVSWTGTNRRELIDEYQDSARQAPEIDHWQGPLAPLPDVAPF